eukprot:g4142.t1
MLVSSRRNAPTSFVVGYATLALVGIGSTAFHATMRREEQMLDEIPMLFAVASMLYLSLTARAIRKIANEAKKGGRSATFDLSRSVLVFCLTLFCLTITILMFVFPENPIIFLASFGGTVALCVCSGIHRYLKGGKSGRPVQRAQSFGELALTLYGVGGIAWCVEPRVCHRVGAIQLHAWWHLAAGVATHMSLQFYWYLELDFLADGEKNIRTEHVGLLPFGYAKEARP